jgi:hypothetical protein
MILEKATRLIPVVCAMCDEVFAARRSTAIFCSSRCRTRRHRLGLAETPAAAPIAAVFLEDLPAAERIKLILGDSIRWRALHDQDDHDVFPHMLERGTPPVDVEVFMAVRAADAAFAATADPDPAIPSLMRAPARAPKRRSTRHVA